MEPLALLGRQRISEAGIEAGTLEGACDRLDCLVRSSGRPLPAGRDSVREEPGRGKLTWLLHSSEVGATEGVTEHGQDVLGVKVVPKADRDRREPREAGT